MVRTGRDGRIREVVRAERGNGGSGDDDEDDMRGSELRGREERSTRKWCRQPAEAVFNARLLMQSEHPTALISDRTYEYHLHCRYYYDSR